MAKRFTHYQSYSHFGFDCLSRECKAYVNSKIEHKERFSDISSGFRTVTKHTKPQPTVRADLRQVTCPECWKNILSMAIAFADNL